MFINRFLLHKNKRKRTTLMCVKQIFLDENGFCHTIG